MDPKNDKEGTIYLNDYNKIGEGGKEGSGGGRKEGSKESVIYILLLH